MISGIRTGPVCDARGPGGCAFISLFVSQFTFTDKFTCQFVRTILFGYIGHGFVCPGCTDCIVHSIIHNSYFLSIYPDVIQRSERHLKYKTL